MGNLVDSGFGFAPKRYRSTTRWTTRSIVLRVEAARRKFSPEFMNRIDKTVVFRTLRPEHLERILEIELGMVQQRVLAAAPANQFVFNCTAKVKNFLLHEGTDPKYGARHLKRSIERNLVFPLANLVATGQVKLGDFIRVDLNAEGQLIFVKEAEGAMAPMLLERYGAAAAVPAQVPRDSSRRNSQRVRRNSRCRSEAVKQHRPYEAPGTPAPFLFGGCRYVSSERLPRRLYVGVKLFTGDGGSAESV